MSKRHQRQRNKDHPCGACILLSILGGNLNVIRSYFFTLIARKREWFWNIRKLPSEERSTIADDISGEVFICLQEKYLNDSLRKISNAKGFLWNTVRNKAIDKDKQLGSERPEKPLLEPFGNGVIENDGTSYWPDTGNTSDSILARRETSETVRKILLKLTPFQRLLVCMRYQEEFSNKEIAEIIGETPNYVAVMLHSIRMVIKSHIMDTDWGKPDVH